MSLVSTAASPNQSGALMHALLGLATATFAAAMMTTAATAQTTAQGATPPTVAPHRVLLAPQSESSTRSQQRWFARPLVTLTGTVVTLDADQVSILLPGQSEATRYASQRVIAIDFEPIPADQSTALESFRSGDYSAALPALIRCVSEPAESHRPSIWRQQWLSMMAAQAAMRGRRGDIAIELVGQLDARPLPAMTMGILPIDWTGKVVVDEAMFETAAKRAGEDSLAVKLVVASWLLRSPKYRSAAEAAIQRLAIQPESPWIAALAGRLVWRTRPPPEIDRSLIQIEAEIDELPLALQAGPMIMLRELAQQSGNQAAAERWRLMTELAAPSRHPDL